MRVGAWFDAVADGIPRQPTADRVLQRAGTIEGALVGVGVFVLPSVNSTGRDHCSTDYTSKLRNR